MWDLQLLRPAENNPVLSIYIHYIHRKHMEIMKLIETCTHPGISPLGSELFQTQNNSFDHHSSLCSTYFSL